MSILTNQTYQITSMAAADKALTLFSVTPANGNNVALSTAEKNTTQKWLYQDDRLLLGFNTSFCLDCYAAAGAAYLNADLWRVAASENINQKIILQEFEDGYRIKLAGKDLYLTANSSMNGTASGTASTSMGNVFWQEYSESCLQLWKFIMIDNIPSENLVLGVRPSSLNYSSGNYTMFSKGQCTWHAHGRAKEKAKKTITFSQNYGLHGKMWWHYVTNCVKSSVPAANSVAVWDNGGAYGHVAYVEKVEAGYVYFTEVNWDTPNGILDAADGVVKRLTTAAFSQRGSYKLSGYLLL